MAEARGFLDLLLDLLLCGGTRQVMAEFPNAPQRAREQRGGVMEGPDPCPHQHYIRRHSNVEGGGGVEEESQTEEEMKKRVGEKEIEIKVRD